MNYSPEDLASAKRLAVKPAFGHAVAMEILAAHVDRLEDLVQKQREALGIPCRCEMIVKAGDEYGDHELSCHQAAALRLTVWKPPFVQCGLCELDHSAEVHEAPGTAL